MKKTIFAILGLLCVLASCTNDDIKITHATTVKVNPSDVVAPFTLEVNPGELESFDSNYKLRVRVLAYDEKGILCAQDEQHLSNYAGISNCSLDLGEGKYRVVAITDVINTTAGAKVPQFWELSGIENLATTKLTDLHYLGGQYKILGVASKLVTISEGENSLTLKPEPVGALCLVIVRNMLHYSNITEYDIDMNRASDFLMFNNDGTYSPAIENNDGQFDWILSSFDRDESSNNVYNYYYLLPMKNISFRPSVKQNDEWLTKIASEKTLNLEAGVEYYINLNLYDTESTQSNHVTFDVLPVTSSRATSSMSEWGRAYNSSTLYLKDINENNSK